MATNNDFGLHVALHVKKSNPLLAKEVQDALDNTNRKFYIDVKKVKVTTDGAYEAAYQRRAAAAEKAAQATRDEASAERQVFTEAQATAQQMSAKAKLLERIDTLQQNISRFRGRNPDFANQTVGVIDGQTVTQMDAYAASIENLRRNVLTTSAANQAAMQQWSAIYDTKKEVLAQYNTQVAESGRIEIETEREAAQAAAARNDITRQQIIVRNEFVRQVLATQSVLLNAEGSMSRMSDGGAQYAARLDDLRTRITALAEAAQNTLPNDAPGLELLRQRFGALLTLVQQFVREVQGTTITEKLSADVDKVSTGLTTLEGKLVTLKGTLSGMADSKPFMEQFESISAAIAQMKTLAENTDIGKPDQVRSLTTLYDALVQRVNEYTVAVRNGKLEDANTSNKEMQSLIAQLDWLDKIAKKRREIQHMYDVNDKVHGTATGAAMQQSIASLDALYNKLLQMDGLTTQQRQEVSRMFKEISIGATSAKQSMEQLGQTGQTMLSKFKAGLQKFGGWTIVTRALTAVIRLARQLVTNVKEIDTAMGQLRIVTGATASEMNKFSNEIAETSKKIGASITDLTDSATVYARLGYTLEESNTLAEYTSMLSKVGDIDVSDAQSAITAITKAFTDIDINNIEDVMNKLVKTGKESCPAA